MTLPSSSSLPEAASLLRSHAESVDRFLESLHQDNACDVPPRLLEAIGYSLLAAGKRVRPALVLETFRACGGAAHAKSALIAAAAIELIHTFSLVHDDLPAMDNDDLRRGRPTNHKVFGEAMAILAGDAMPFLAFEMIATEAEPTLVRPLVSQLALAAGPAGMIGGQVLDMAGERQTLSLDQLRQVHQMKTGALLQATCRMGALCAEASNDVFGQIDRFARHVGLAFQIVDDILDVTSTPEQLGKATGKDAGKGKNTYPKLLGLESSREWAGQELASALEAIDRLGPAADGLRALARFVVRREK